MKKIVITFGLCALLVMAACNSTKNTATAAAPPPPPLAKSTAPQKGEMKESDMQPAPALYEKKSILKKSRQPVFEAVSVPDTIK